ncbi:MAG: tetratricopeptide repeat protein [bacterium]|nr:tetratricopeptide repeat protein [bacterium]
MRRCNTGSLVIFYVALLSWILPQQVLAQSTDNLDSLAILRLKNELLSIEKQLTEITRLSGTGISDPNSLASQRFTELRERQVAIERRIKMLSYKGLDNDSLRILVENYQREKERINRESQSLRKVFIARCETFLNQWRQTDPRQRLQIPDDLIAQIVLRLAELYAFEAFDDYGEAMEKWNKNPTLPEPKVNYNKAAKTFAEVVRDFPNSRWAPDAMYSLAYIKTEQANPDPFIYDPLRDEARSLYTQLIEYYPTSRYVDEAYFALGDYWFHTPPKNTKPAQQLDSAEYYYKLIVQRGNKNKLGTAYYMLGWTQFRRNTGISYARAVEYFEKTIYFYTENPEIVAISKRDDREEAIKYIAGIFVDQGKVWNGSGAANAVQFVEADSFRANTYGTKMLEILGQQLTIAQNAYDSAIYVWKGAIRIAPLNERAPFIQKNILDMARYELNNMNLWYVEGIKLFENYNSKSPWWAANTSPKIRKQIRSMIRTVYDEVTRYAVARSIDNTRPDYNPSMIDEAIKLASGMVNEFPNDSAAYEWNFQVANMLASPQVNRIEEAYEEYKKVSENYPFTWHKQESNLQMLLLANEKATTQLKAFPYKEAETDTATGLPLAVNDTLTDGEKLLILAADKYANSYPQDDTISSTYLYKAGLVLYRRGYIDSSATFFNRVIKNYPTSKAYESAFQLYVNTFLVKRDFKGAEVATQELIAAPVSDSLKVFAKERRAAAAFFNAAGLQASAEKILEDTTTASKSDAYRIYEEAGDNYVKVAVETDPQFFKDGDLALENAALSYRKAQKPEKVIYAYNLLVEKFPTSNRVPRALYNSGLILQNELKNNLAAAQKFELLVKNYPKGEYDVKQALINASYNYEEAKDYSSAVRINQEFAKLFPNEPEAVQLLFKTAGLYLKLGNVDGANKIYEEFARQYPNSPNTVVAHYERAKYADERNDRVVARREYQLAYERHNQLVAAGGTGNPEYASKALYRITQWDLDTYRNIQFTASKQYREGVQQRDQKKALREILFNNIRNLVQLSQIEQFEALYWAGELDENFGTTHLNQKVEPAKDAITNYDNRELIIEETIEFYKLAVKEYANSLVQYDKAIELLEQQYNEQVALRDTLFAQIEKMTQSNASGIADSNTVLEVRNNLVNKLNTALVEAKRWRERAREKAPELAFRNAMLKKEILLSASALPDVPNPKIKDVDVGRTLYRQQVLSGVIGEFTKKLFESFMEAIKVAREAGYEEKWAQPARVEMASAVDFVLKDASQLNQRWFDIFQRYHQDIQNLLPRGEGARDRQRREVLTIASELEQIVALYAGDKGVTAVVNKIINELIEIIQSDEKEFVAMQPMVEKVLKWYLDEAEKTVPYIEISRNADISAKNKFAETSQYQYEDAYLKYESIRLYFESQYKDLLSSGYDLSERYKFDSPTVPMLIQKLAEIDPETYGAKVGITVKENVVYSDENWIAIDKYIEGFTESNLDLTGWRYAEISPMVFNDSAKAVLGAAKPIHYVTKPNGTKTWFRKAVWIPERVTSASLSFVADQIVSVFANKEFLYSTPEEVTDWTMPVTIDVSPIIKAGYNVLTFEVEDTDGSNNGIAVMFKYRTVPGVVTPVYPEPPNASTINNVKRGLDIPPPVETKAEPTIEKQEQVTPEAPTTGTEAPVAIPETIPQQPVETPIQQATPVQEEQKEVVPETEIPVSTPESVPQQPVETPTQQAAPVQEEVTPKTEQLETTPVIPEVEQQKEVLPESVTTPVDTTNTTTTVQDTIQTLPVEETVPRGMEELEEIPVDTSSAPVDTLEPNQGQ